MKPGICFRSRKFESHIIFIGQSYFFKTNNTNQFSHVFKTDVGELIGIATSQKNGLQKYNLIPNFSNSGGIWCIGTLPNNNFLCTFLISVNHTSFKQSGVSLLQIIGTGDENFKANYKSLIKGTQEAKFYAKYNEKGINVYVDAPANITVSILSYSHMAKDFYFNLQKQESLPEGCTQAVDVDTL